MSHFATVRRRQPVVAPGATPNNTYAPEISGIPQENQLMGAYGGQYVEPITDLRFTRRRLNGDGTVAFSYTPVIQSSGTTGFENYQFTPSSADVDYGYDVLVEASLNNRSTWSAPISCSYNTAYPSDVILPFVIPDPVVVWNAATSKFDITQKPYQALNRLYKVESQDLTAVEQFGYLVRSENELQGSQTVDLSGATDPAPDPPITSIGSTKVFSVQDTTPDYQYAGQNNAIVGSASEWIAASATLGTGISRVRILNTGGAVAWIPFFQLKHGGTGVDILQSWFPDTYPRFGRALRSSIPKSTWDPNFSPPLMLVDNNLDFTRGKIPGTDWVEFDWGVQFNDLTLLIGSMDGWPPLTSATITTYNAAGTLVRTISFVSGSYTPNETKTVSLP
jgi:hypothetical protein